MQSIHHKNWKKLSAVILAAMGVAVSFGGTAMAANYSEGLTGVVEEDRDIIGSDGNTVENNDDTKTITYDFKGKDHTFTVINQDGIGTNTDKGDYNYVFNNVDENGNKGTLHIDQTNNHPNDSEGVTGFSASKGQVTVNSNLDITAYSAYASTGISAGMGANLTINGNVTMRKNDTENPWGIVTKNVHGNYGPGGGASADGSEKYTGARWNPAGFSVGATGGSITVNGDVDIAVRGTAVKTDAYGPDGSDDSYNYAVINLIGNNIRIDTPVKEENEVEGFGKFIEPYYSLASYGGTINVNVENQEAKTGTVQMVGNIIAMKRSAFTEKNDSGNYLYQNGRINIGLTTVDSSWTGLIDNAGTLQAGEVNLWLKNGAQWNYENASRKDGLDASNLPDLSRPAYENYDGVSHLNRLIGGSSAETAGIIQIKEEDPIEITSVEGITKIWYDHADATPGKIIGGDVKVLGAKAGAQMMLYTGNNGLTKGLSASSTAADRNAVSAVLNELAHKLWYMAGDTNLTGTVHIAEGLTAGSASASLRNGNISFSTADTGTKQVGQGFYDYTPEKDTKTYETGAIKKSENIGETRESDVNGLVTINVTEAQTGVPNSAPSALYALADAEAPLVVDLQGHILQLSTGGDANKYLSTVYVDDGKTIQIKDSKGNGSVKISTGVGEDGNADNNTNYTYGIRVSNKGSLISDVNVDVDGVKSNGTSRAYGIYVHDDGNVVFNKDLAVKGVQTANKIGTNTAGIYLDNNASMTIHGNMDIENIAGHAIRAMTGSTLTTAGGVIKAMDMSNGTDYSNYYALFANKGTINLNTGDGITPGVIDVTGDMKVYNDAKSVINVNLTNGSKWTGAASNTASSSYNPPSGQINLTMAEGASWTHQTGLSADTLKTSFAGSNITKLNGTGGAIYQMSDKPITIYNYSGDTTVVYQHDADNPLSMIGGDFTIKAADVGSTITLMTDSKGISAGFSASDTAAERNHVKEILNKLAQKLTYTGYSDGHVTGVVKIADGLTASSVKASGEITFANGTGQGFYDYTPEKPSYRTGAITTSEDISLTREPDEAGVIHVDVSGSDANVDGNFLGALFASESADYSNPMKVQMNGKGLSIQAESNNKQVAGIYVSNNKYINITNPSSDQVLSITATNTDTRGAHGIYALGNAHLNITGPVEIKDVTSEGNSANGINLQGQQANITIDGSLKISNIKPNGKRAVGLSASGILVTGDKSSVTVIGPVDISGVEGSGIKLVGADTKVSVGGGTITAAVDKDKSKNYYAARVDKGQLDINMKDGQAASTTTKITGDLFVTGQYGKKVVEYSGGELIDWADAGVLNVALTDKDSFWTGAAVYDQYTSDYGTGGSTVHDIGQLNLYLQNGATWTNEIQSHGTTTTTDSAEWAGSTLASLHGGIDADHAGVIYQKDSHPISVVDYSGYTEVHYEHDTSDPTSIIGGDFKITNAAEGSSITLTTSREGISNDETLITKVLNGLAGKLYDKSYADGNLVGVVKIAAGLTASEVTEKINFSTDKVGTGKEGQGYYKLASTDPGEEGQTETNFTQAIFGVEKHDTQYVDAKVRQNDGTYRFTKDSNITLDTEKSYEALNASKNAYGTYQKIRSNILALSEVTSDQITIDATDHDLNLKLSSNINDPKSGDNMDQMEDNSNVSLITASGTKNKKAFISIKAKNLNLSMADDTLSKVGLTDVGAGIVADSNSQISIDGNVNMNTIDGAGILVGHSGGSDDEGNFSENEVSITGDVTISGAKAGINISGGQSKVIIGGKTTMSGMVKGGYGIGIFNIDGSSENLSDETDISIGAAALQVGAGNTALRADKGTININTGVEGTTTGTTTITGNVITKGGHINLALNDENSYLKGRIQATSGTVDMTLADKATWFNEGTISGNAATHLNSLSGNGGLIYQNGTDDIQIDNYKGEHYVFYAHDESNPTTIIGGDIRIAKTDGSAKIHLITDSKGIKAGFNANDTAEDQNMVSEVLNKLAQKVFYTANDGHLFGTVKIASGLTLSESYLKEGTLSFSDGTTGTGTAGQGYYNYTPVDDSIITAKITGGNDTKYVNMGIETDKGIYKFTKDATIHVTKGSYSSELGAIESSNGPIVIDADGKALDVSYTVEEGSNVARGVATGMSSGRSKDISIKAGKLNLASKTSGWRAQGVYAAGGTITIDADTIISTSASTETNGIYAGSKGKVTMNGDLTINDDNTTGTYYALKADNDGIINVNLKDGKAAEGTVQLKGDIFTQSTESYDWDDEESTTTSSTINLALKGKDSNWTGRSLYEKTSSDDNSTSYGNFNLYLEDGATWTNQKMGKDTPSGFAGSHVTQLSGQGGYIVQNDTSAISLDHYSGDTTVIYKHEVKENTERENASDYGNQEVSIIGGDFKIAKAQADSNITLVTDRTGLNTDSNKAADQNLISDALNKLANKLFYTANDGNLKGKVQIASGLTASEVTATLKSGDISFKDNGQGYYDYKLVVRPDHQTETKFTTAITGDAAQDEYYAEKGVLKDDGSYVFTEDATIITPEKHLIELGAWMPTASAAISGADADHNVTIDMKGNKLTIDTTTDTHTTGIAAIGDGVVEVNDAGAISINAESTKSGQTAALYVNGGGTIKIHNSIDDNVLTLRAKSKQPANAAVIKATNGKSGVMSSVTIDGLVDILADKSEASGANEAISVVASKVEIGGGTIKAVNGASYAIRAYGEMKSTNRATVNVNVKKDADGNIIGAGNNLVQMEGDVFLSGSMDQGGARADVTVGLNTKDSYWKGNVGMETFANGSALGIYNLYMGNGATWTGNNVSKNTVNANLDSGASWTGHSTGNAMHLTLNNGAFWNVDGDSTLASFNGKDGFIHMDGDQAGNVSITDYNGNTTVIYKHEIVGDTERDHASLYGDKAASILGGDVKITNAAEGSTITLVTDRAGLNLDSKLYSDKNLINDVLDKLANKLFYTNYADGHLTGFVKIAEGLTASSITRIVKSGDISYKENGQGYYDYDVIYPNEQVKDPMNTVIDGSESSKDTYREAGIYKDANNSYQFTKDPSTITSDGNSTGLIEAKDNDVNVVANKTLKLKGKDGGVGILAEAGKTSKNDANMDITVNDGTGILADAGHVEITGNVTIEAKNSSSDITVAEDKDAMKATGEASRITLQNGMVTENITASEAGNVEIKAGTGMEAKNGGTITIGGRSDITVAAGQDAVKATGEGSQITLKTGMIKGNITASNSGKVSTNGADIMGDVNASSEGDVTIKAGTVTGNLLSDGGTISTNETTVTGDVNAKAGSVDMISGRVTGDVNAAGGKVSMGGTHVTGRVNATQGGEVAMTNGNAAGITVDKDSKASAVWDKKNFTWTGDVDNAGDVTISFLNGASWTGDSKGDGNTNITIGKDSTWTGQNSNVNTDLTLEGTWKETGESRLKSLAGQGGVLDMTSNAAGNTTIGTFSGSMRAIYKHDEAKPTHVQGGIITVNDATEGAKVDLITDSKGLKLSSNRKEDKDTVSETLNQLAHKLIYKGEAGKLTGTIGIAEGLTSTSATLHAENISFDGNGMGQFKYDPAKSGIIIEYSSEETRMMQGTKSSLLGTAMMWRTNNNDLLRRMGDLRLNQGEAGAWARYVGGKNKFDQQHTYLSQSYNIAQVGYDKKVGDWSIGLALDHGNGKNSFIGGKAKEKMTTLAFYGSKVSDDGSYIDIILKTGKVSNKFDVSNEVGNRLHSDYDTWGNSLSVEYGKRFTKDDGFYLDPSVEFTMGRLNSKTYIGTSDLGELQVRQHAFDSAIGRIGFSIGKEMPRSNVYAKLALAHEFGGAFKTDFYADDGGLRSTRIDLSDTWLDMELGGTVKLGERTSLYGNFTRSFASDVTTKWRVDAGVRFTF